MIKLKSEKGSISLLVIALLAILVMIGMFFIQVANINFKSVFLDSFKLKSNETAKHALSMYLDDVAKYYINKNDVDSSMLEGVKAFRYIPNLGKKIESVLNGFKIKEDNAPEDKNKFAYYYSTFKTSENTDINSSYILAKNSSTKNEYQHRFYTMTPPVDEAFTTMKDESNNVITLNNKKLAQIDISGVYNKSLNDIEFFVVAYEEATKKILIYSHTSFIDTGFNLEKEITISDLYKLKDNTSTKDSLSLNDDVKIQTIWNDSINSIEVHIAIGEKKQQIKQNGVVQDISPSSINIFNYNPYLDDTLQYEQTLTADFDKMSFCGLFDVNINDVELFLTLQKDNLIDVYTSFPRQDINFKNVLDVGHSLVLLDDIPVNMDTDVCWSKTTNSTSLFLALISKTKQEVTYYNLIPPIEDTFTKQTELTMNTDVASMGADFYAEHIAIGCFFDTALSTTRIYTAIGDVKDDKLLASSRYLDIDNYEKNDIIKSVDEGVGRIALSGVLSDFSEIILVNPTPIIKDTLIVNKPALSNITAINYNNNNTEMSKSNMKANIQLEYLEPEVGSINRIIKKLNILDLKLDE